MLPMVTDIFIQWRKVRSFAAKGWQEAVSDQIAEKFKRVQLLQSECELHTLVGGMHTRLRDI